MTTRSRPTRSPKKASGREQVLRLPDAKQHTVLEHVATVVTPDLILGMTDGTGRRIAGEHPGQISLRIASADAVLVERRGVEHPHAIAHRKVFEFLGEVVLLGHEIAGPVTPQPRGVGSFDPVVKRCRLDHGHIVCRGFAPRARPPGAVGWRPWIISRLARNGSSNTNDGS
jgi:hypothetical protein